MRKKNSKAESQNSDTAGTTEPSHPLLPIDGFPPPVQEFIQTCADTYNTPRDYWAGAVLASTALAIGDKIQLVGKFTDVPIIWLCNVGDVSIGKTEPLKQCLKYFEDKDDESIRRYREEIELYERKQQESEERIPIPRCFQYIIKDATPEAMAQVHIINDRGLMYYRDELKGMIDDFGRYNKSGEQSSMLSTFSRVSMTINRKGSGPINIAKPCILIAGGMQPDLLPTLAQDNRAESGFLARIVFIYPDNTTKPYYNKAILPERLRDGYNRYLDQLTSLPRPLTLVLSKEAEEEFEGWYNHNVDAINKAPNGYIKGVFGKLEIYCLRMVTVIRGMRLVHEGDVTEEVTLDEIKSAIKITEYFRATALKVYRKIFIERARPDIERKDVIGYLRNLNVSISEIARILNMQRPHVYRYL